MKTAPFDYQSADDAASREDLRAAARQILTIEAGLARGAIDVGGLLRSAHDSVARGCWKAWVRAELGWAVSTATILMAVHRVFGQVDCVDRFQRTALIELARDFVVDASRKEALDLARGGRLITRRLALELIDKHRPAPASIRLPDARHVNRRDLHRVRSSLRRIILSCPAADREALHAELRELIGALLAELPSTHRPNDRGRPGDAALALGVPMTAPVVDGRRSSMAAAH